MAKHRKPKDYKPKQSKKQVQEKPNIKWRDKDIAELQRVVKNYNAKISRLIKKDASYIDYVPERKSAAELRKYITNRQEFNRILNSLKRFSVKGSEKKVETKKGVFTTKYEVKELQIQTRSINTQRSKQNIDDSKKAFNIERMDQKMFEKFRKRTEQETHVGVRTFLATIYKENYLAAWDENMGGIRPDIREKIVNLKPEVVLRLGEENPNMSIEYLYGADKAAGKASEIGGIIDANTKEGDFL